MEKDENLIEDFDTTVGLATGESYIIFNNLKGKIVVWINCDKEMSVLMTLEELKKSASSIFPDVNLSSLLFYLNRGDYVYTDKKIVIHDVFLYSRILFNRVFINVYHSFELLCCDFPLNSGGQLFSMLLQIISRYL